MRDFIVTIIIIIMDAFLFEADKQLLQLSARIASRWVTINKLQLCLLWLSFLF